MNLRSNFFVASMLALSIIVSMVLMTVTIGSYFKSLSLWVNSNQPAVGPVSDPVLQRLRDYSITRATLGGVVQEFGAKGNVPKEVTMKMNVAPVGVTWTWSNPFVPRSIEHSWGIAGYQHHFNFQTSAEDGQAKGFRVYSRIFEIRISLWPLAVLPIVASVWLSRRYRDIRRRQRAEQQLCINCGYDLRASPQRCPECGMEFTADRPKVETSTVTDGLAEDFG